jgi:hypothetical protein
MPGNQSWLDQRFFQIILPWISMEVNELPPGLIDDAIPGANVPFIFGA